ncbi:MAG: tetratricopeptide repeat protein [bacterium]|nr:tetratricopeptide repeat protein [bacterium]
MKNLYKPAESAEELARLESRLRGSRAGFVVLMRLWLIASAFLVVIDLASCGFQGDLHPAARFWAVIPILAMGVGVAGAAASQLWAAPRLLAVQRQLLSARRRGDAELGEEIGSAEARIRAGLEALSPRRDTLEAALEGAERRSRRQLERLARNGVDLAVARLGRGAREGPLLESAGRLRVGLESYRAALAGVEIDCLLEACLLEPGSGVSLALGRAGDHLDTLPRPEAAGRAASDDEAVPNETRPSIAVLPFADLSPQRDQEYFCHGLADELINALTKVRQLRVVARTSAFSLRNEQLDVREIGRRLQVETILEGSVRRAGDRLRITAQLVRAADGLHLWSERYDRQVGDVFAIQDEITVAITAHLEVELLASGRRPSRQRQTEDIEAYHLYLKGRHFWSKRSPADLEESIAYFLQAIARDPRYALAHAGLADSYNLLGYYSVLAPSEAFPRAKEAAHRALEIDDDLAEAHSSLAFANLLFDWDWPGAEREFRRTFELNPGYATAHHWFAELLALRGRHEEAIEQVKLALDLDPLSLIINTLLGWVYYYARRYEEAIAALEETLELGPGFAPAVFWLGLTHQQQGRLEDAAAVLLKAIEHSDRSPMMVAALGRLHALMGEPDAARAVLAELEDASRPDYVPAYYIAAIHAGGGDREKALDWLERSREARENWMVFLGVDPIWDALRAEPRFTALLAEVGLTRDLS